jgi:hypothetical protein
VLNNIVVTDNRVSLSLNDNFVSELKNITNQLGFITLTHPLVVELKLTEVKNWDTNINSCIDTLVAMFMKEGCVALSATIVEDQLDVMPEEGNVLMNDPHNSTRIFFNSDSAIEWLNYEVSKTTLESADSKAA